LREISDSLNRGVEGLQCSRRLRVINGTKRKKIGVRVQKPSYIVQQSAQMPLSSPISLCYVHMKFGTLPAHQQLHLHACAGV
jgi:hypothetical protein